LIQEKKDLQNELHSYMNRFSELQIHKENLEANLNNQIKVIEAKLASNNLLVQQKDSQVNMNKFFIRIRHRILMRSKIIFILSENFKYFLLIFLDSKLENQIGRAKRGVSKP